MMLLVDACVWSLSLRRRSRGALNAEEQRMVASLQEAIQDGRVAIIGPIRQEILSRLRDKAQFSKTQHLLAPFPDENLIPADSIEAARFFNLCQDRGVQCGSIDMLIAAVAARRNLTVLTLDQALIRCLKVLGIPHL